MAIDFVNQINILKVPVSVAFPVKGLESAYFKT